jgi:hypothetical protein
MFRRDRARRGGRRSGYNESCLSTLCNPSIAKWLPCMVSAVSPPSAETISSRFIRLASSNVIPCNRSHRQDEHAIAVTHPRVLNLASLMRPSLTRAANCITSPQAGFSTVTIASGASISPANRGCSKWSSTCAEYMPPPSPNAHCKVNLCPTCLSALCRCSPA